MLHKSTHLPFLNFLIFLHDTTFRLSLITNIHPNPKLFRLMYGFMTEFERTNFFPTYNKIVPLTRGEEMFNLLRQIII